MRRTIVFEVIIMKEALKDVCDRYHINFSSAKNVIQIYKKEGRLEKKVVKTKRIGGKRNHCGNESSESEDDEEGSEEVAELDENGNKIVTLAPKEKRCSLNLFITFDKEEEVHIYPNPLTGEVQKFYLFPSLIKYCWRYPTIRCLKFELLRGWEILSSISDI